MSDNLPERRIHIGDLSLDERASLSYRLFMEWSTRGRSFNALAKQENMDARAVKKLIDEHAAFERNQGSDTKMANFNAYRYLLGKSQEIIENPSDYPALLQAKAYEAYIQALTRMDKLGGHEAPTMQGTIPGETVADMIRQAYAENAFSDISPQDHGQVSHEIEAHEDGDDDDDDEDDGILVPSR